MSALSKVNACFAYLFRISRRLYTSFKIHGLDKPKCNLNQWWYLLEKYNLNKLQTNEKRLTHKMAMIQPSFSSSKWNMGEILPFLA